MGRIQAQSNRRVYYWAKVLAKGTLFLLADCTYFLDDLDDPGDLVDLFVVGLGFDGGEDCPGLLGGLRNGFLGPAALFNSLLAEGIFLFSYFS